MVGDQSNLGALRVSLGLDSAQFTQSIADINRKLKAVKSEFNAASDGTKGFAQSLEGLKNKNTTLNRQVELQAEKLKELKRQYEVSKRESGEHAAATVNLAKKVNDATFSLKKSENQLKDTNKQLTLQESALNRSRTTWGKLENKLKDVSDRFEKTGRKMKDIGSGAAQGLGTATLAVGGGLALATKEAMNFEAQMSSVKSVMSPDEVKTFEGSLKDLAMEMGAKTKYSAVEAAEGIEELIKAGVSVTDIVNGGLNGALSLATAGELELGDAAEIASTALNAFKDDNISVTRAADILAGTANASATSVSEMKFGLSAVAAVASGVGLTFEDTSATLGVFAQNGLKGSDAGTSLKTMLLNLQPSTKESSALMSRLGLSTMNTQSAMKFLSKNGIEVAGNSWKDASQGLYKYIEQEYGLKGSSKETLKAFNKLVEEQGFVQSAFYDSEGSIKSMNDISGILKDKLGGMTDAQRQMALKTMFGTDAIRAGNILYKEGAEGIDKMTTSLNKIKAADVAKEKLDNMKGTIEQLKGSFSTMGISIGNALIPALKGVTKGIQGAVDWFNNLSPKMQSTLAISAGVAGAMLAVATAIAGVVAIVGGAVLGIGAISGALAAAGIAIGPVLIVTGAVIALGIAGAALYANWDKLKKYAPILQNALLGVVPGLGLIIKGVQGIKKANEEVLPSQARFGESVSAGTKKAITAYLKLEEKATQSLKGLSWSGQKITKDMADKIYGHYQDMGNSILKAMDKNHDEQLKKRRKLFDDNNALSEEEEAKINAKTEKKYESDKKKLKDQEAQIKKILDNAVKEKRALTKKEQEQIDSIREDMRKTAVKTMSKSEKEQIAILSSLKTESGKLTARQAAEIVQNSVKAKNGSVKEAEKTYKGQVKQIEYMRDVTGELTDKQAAQMIKAAKKTRDDSVKAAEDMNKKVVSAAKKQAKGHIDEIDWETGEVKDGWDTMMDSVGKAVNWFKGLFGKGKVKSPPKTSTAGKSRKLYPNGKTTSERANGTPSGRHTQGMALVGEEGPELAHLPGQGITMLGVGGQHFADLPDGTSVLPTRHTKQVLKQYGIPMYANGIGDYFDVLMKGPKAVWGTMTDKFDITDRIIPSWANELTGSPTKAIGNMLSGGIKKTLDDLFSFGGGDAPNISGGAGNWRNQIMMAAMAMKESVTAAQVNGIIAQIQRESGGNQRIVQSSSVRDINTLSGNPARGLLQYIPQTFASYSVKGHKNIYSGYDQLLAFFNNKNWKKDLPYGRSGWGPSGGRKYEKGGIVDREQMALVGERDKEEAIIPLEQHRGRAIQLWKAAGEKLGMFKAPTPQNINRNMGGNAAGSSTINNVSNTYKINLQATINNDQDIEQLATKIRKSIERQDMLDSRSYGVSLNG